MTRITILTEELKNYGLTETECSRIRQYEAKICDSLEKLRYIKQYRTPETLRTFIRLFIIALPAFYAPAFAQISYNLDSIWYGIIFAIITNLALNALFESIEELEDPFLIGSTILDGIDIIEEFEILFYQQLINTREIVYGTNASMYDPATTVAASIGYDNGNGGGGGGPIQASLTNVRGR